MSKTKRKNAPGHQPLTPRYIESLARSLVRRGLASKDILEGRAPAGVYRGEEAHGGS
ncbi:hypothetical protein [Sinomonas sp. P10A9]|uniref:Uncharacterized protein n=1 Tax=Sinomonas puerhi TaxID=3238584 RepID=A0AB39L276_9MICC